ncbi:MAG: SUMF1/EgtB/PvdO family nonheme iron enzyme [Anaerolineales bacterium]|nr:SUMF1/EgtB/PvdO family nonheme iron enzyme [Anaerolineales bacterium]
MTRPLSVFLCHASQDKPAVRELYKRLSSEKWIDPWLDEENLLPGQDFDFEIIKAARDADAIIICLSKVSVAKEGYVNKEIRRALDVADEKPEGTIYVIPLRLDECEPSFERLKKLHWADYFNPNSHEKLLKSLHARAVALNIEIPENVAEIKVNIPAYEGHDLHDFIQIPVQENSKVPHPFWIGKYPVTNSQYERFLDAPDFSNPVYWLDFLKFDVNCQPIGDWGKSGFNFLQEELKKTKSHTLIPRFWDHKDFGRSNPHHPLVGVSWFEASAYCEWLLQNWDRLPEGKENPQLRPQSMRLPLETEWVLAAGGGIPEKRYPWDEAGNATTSLKVLLQRANIEESGIAHTTPVFTYPLGKSTLGVMDMAGNVWEWQANFINKEFEWLAFRGGSWYLNQFVERFSGRLFFHISRPTKAWNDYGFRVLALPSS